jgi:hypothetical protein
MCQFPFPVCQFPWSRRATAKTKPFNLALVHLGFGDRARPLDNLERALAADSRRMAWIDHDHILDPDPAAKSDSARTIRYGCALRVSVRTRTIVRYASSTEISPRHLLFVQTERRWLNADTHGLHANPEYNTVHRSVSGA